MISKTKISKRARKKTNINLVKTILACKKHEKWLEIGKLLSQPRSKKIGVNLNTINEKSEEGDIIVIPGKVLSQGSLNKKIRLVCFAISEKAKEKAKQSKSEIITIDEEVKENPEAKAIKIVK